MKEHHTVSNANEASTTHLMHNYEYRLSFMCVCTHMNSSVIQSVLLLRTNKRTSVL